MSVASKSVEPGRETVARERNGTKRHGHPVHPEPPTPPVPKAKTEMRPQDAVPGSKGLAGLQSNAGSSPGDRPSSARRASERRVWATPSPQERAAKHAAKVKARDSRLFESSPGPGAYSTNGRTPRGGASLQSLGGGRAVFRSRSLQRQKVDSIGRGPGAYNAADALDNVSRSSFLSAAGSSFNRAARAGQGGFGGLGSRDLRLEILGEDTPGPGAYRGLAATLLNAHQGRMPSAAFRSLSAQRPSFHARHGPATLLEPKYHVVEPRVRDTFGAVMRSRSERFGAPTRILTRPDSTTCATVGPLSYDPHHALAKKLGEQAIYVHAVGRDAPGTAAFRSESVREMRAPIW